MNNSPFMHRIDSIVSSKTHIGVADFNFSDTWKRGSSFDHPCRFCGHAFLKHRWSFNVSIQKYVAIDQPSSCSLDILLNKIRDDFNVLQEEGSIVWTNYLWRQKPERHQLLTLNWAPEGQLILYTSWPSKISIPYSMPAATVDELLEESLQWIQNCNLHHKTCHDIDDCIPSRRILDLSTAHSTGIVRLTPTKLITGKYIALSYCWGDASPPKTTKKSIQSHEQGMRLSSFPKAFKDAITVCFAFGINFLWIDSLCIVQDDEVEWQSEAEMMGLIYEKSYLTIAATRASNPTEGFLFDRPEDTVRKYQISSSIIHQLSRRKSMKSKPRWRLIKNKLFRKNRKTGKNEDKHVQTDTLFVKRHIEYHYGGTCGASLPLHKRAWCLQEWILPKRVLSFGPDENHFLCAEEEHCSCKESLEPSLPSRLRSKFTSDQEAWDLLLHDYNDRAMSHPSDRLPALSGLAERYQLIRNDVYLAGLWQSSIIADLCWFCVARTNPIGTWNDQAPSWTWASIYIAPLNDQQHHLRANGPPSGRKSSRHLAELVEVHCSGFGRPLGGSYLKLTALISPAILFAEFNALTGYNYTLHCLPDTKALLWNEGGIIPSALCAQTELNCFHVDCHLRSAPFAHPNCGIGHLLDIIPELSARSTKENSAQAWKPKSMLRSGDETSGIAGQDKDFMGLVLYLPLLETFDDFRYGIVLGILEADGSAKAPLADTRCQRIGMLRGRNTGSTEKLLHFQAKRTVTIV